MARHLRAKREDRLFRIELKRNATWALLPMPARRAQDRGAAICAALVFAPGATAIMLHGARESDRD